MFSPAENVYAVSYTAHFGVYAVRRLSIFLLDECVSATRTHAYPCSHILQCFDVRLSR